MIIILLLFASVHILLPTEKKFILPTLALSNFNVLQFIRC